MWLGFVGRRGGAGGVEKVGAEVAFGAVAEESGNGGVGAESAGEAEGADDVGAGAGADEEAEFAMEALGHLHGFAAGDFEMAVQRSFAEEFGDEAVGDAFD